MMLHPVGGVIFHTETGLLVRLRGSHTLVA
jgi:hypothetical protein